MILNATGEPPVYYMRLSGYWPLHETGSAWNCPNCGALRFSNSVHHCITTPRVGFTATPERKPHKCPICEGTGEVDGKGTTYPKETCHVCKGECVLWG
jgi:hypothetical protein